MRENITDWFRNTEMGCYVVKKEQHFFSKNMINLTDGVSVQMGAYLQLEPSENIIVAGRDVLMDADAGACADGSLDSLLLVHAHEYCVSPETALEEAYRMLKPEGRVLLTGFNPYSLWRFSGWFDGTRLPRAEKCMPLKDLKDALKDTGFEIEFGCFMVYLPPLERMRNVEFWRFLESAGDRWWPHNAAVYGLTAVKRVAGMTPLPEYGKLFEHQEGMVFGAARVGSHPG